MVKAVVTAGSYTSRDKNGAAVVVHPGQGDDSIVDVPDSHLKAFSGVLTPHSEYVAQNKAAAKAAAAAEDDGKAPTGGKPTK